MFKSVKIAVMAALALAVFVQPAMSREFADIYTDCGIGAMIAPRNSAVAAVTNVTWDLGTTAISSHITTPDSCTGGQDRRAAFIYDSYELLEKDLAGGHGTYLDTLVVLAGLDPQAGPEFTEALRRDFAALASQPTYSDQSRFEKAEALFNLVNTLAAAVS